MPSPNFCGFKQTTKQVKLACWQVKSEFSLEMAKNLLDWKYIPSVLYRMYTYSVMPGTKGKCQHLGFCEFCLFAEEARFCEIFDDSL